MHEVSVIKFGVGVINSYGFRNRVDAVAKRDELKAQYPASEYNITLEWWN